MKTFKIITYCVFLLSFTYAGATSQADKTKRTIKEDLKDELYIVVADLNKGFEMLKQQTQELMQNEEAILELDLRELETEIKEAVNEAHETLQEEITENEKLKTLYNAEEIVALQQELMEQVTNSLTEIRDVLKKAQEEQKQAYKDQKIEQKEVELEDFNELSVERGVPVKCLPGEELKLIIKGPEDDIKKIKYDISDDELEISRKSSFFSFSRNKCSIILYYKDLREIKSSSAARIMVKGHLQHDEVEVSASSGSSITIEKLSAEELQAKARSGASVSIVGTADEVELKASSGASLNAAKLTAKQAEAKASSGGSVRLQVQNDLTAQASSGGYVGYKGDPEKKDVSRSSGGNVNKEE